MTTTSTSSTSSTSSSTSSTSSSTSSTSTSASSTSVSTSSTSSSTSTSSTSTSVSSTSSSISSTSISSTSSSTSVSSTSISISSTSTSSTSTSSTSSSISISSTSTSFSSTSSSVSSTSVSTSSTSLSSTSSSSSTSSTTLPPPNIKYDYEDLLNSNTTIAVDSTLVGTAGGNGVNSLTLSGFSTGGPNRLVLVLEHESQDASSVQSVTASGLTFSRVAGKALATNSGNIEVWGAWATAQQTSTVITITYKGNNFPQASARTFCFSGTDIRGTVAAAIGSISTVGASDSTPTAAIMTTRPGSLCIATVGQAASSGVTAGSNQTDDGDTPSGGGSSTISAIRQNSPAANLGKVQMDVTLSAPQAYAMIAIELLAPASNVFTVTNYSNVLADDGDYFIQYGSEYVISRFKKTWTNNTDTISIIWQGRSTESFVIAPIFLQIYNQNTSAWETIASETVIRADTDITLRGSQTTNLSNYYDSTNTVVFRVYQQVI